MYTRVGEPPKVAQANIGHLFCLRFSLAKTQNGAIKHRGLWLEYGGPRGRPQPLQERPGALLELVRAWEAVVRQWGSSLASTALPRGAVLPFAMPP